MGEGDYWLSHIRSSLALTILFFFVQELASHMGFPDDSVKHFPMTHDIGNLLMFVDIVLYGSLRQEPGFPPLLLRSMSSEIPIIAPNLTVITKYVCYLIHSIICSLLCHRCVGRSFSQTYLLFSGH